MKFQGAVERTPHLKGKWQKGLQALRAQDKVRLDVDDTTRLRGSVDVDTALKKIEPRANRWDFAIGYQHTNRKAEFIYWVETHTGSDKQVSVVQKKAAWLLGWLCGDGKPLAGFEREIVWVPSGATSFTAGSTQVKTLATQGIRYSGSVFRIPDARPDMPVVTSRARRRR